MSSSSFSFGSLFALGLSVVLACGDDSGEAGHGGGGGPSDTGGAGGGEPTGGAGGAAEGGAGGAAQGGGGAGVGGGSGGEGGMGGEGGGGGGTPGCPIHVTTSGDDFSDGSSWADAVGTLNVAVALAESRGCDVWVAEGTYKPTDTTDRTVSIELRPGVAVYGGFDGDEDALEDRDVDTFVTILSGDIGVELDDADNSHHVLVGADGARLDGFTIQDGRADVPEHLRGAGLLHESGDLTIANCVFRDNATGDAAPVAGAIGADGGPGGAIYHAGGLLTVESTVFDNNRTGNGNSGTSIGGTGGTGGAIAVFTPASLTVVGSTFEDNMTGRGGNTSGTQGGIGGYGGPGGAVGFLSIGGSLIIEDSTFSGNTTGFGGACQATSGGVGGMGGKGGAVSVVYGDVLLLGDTFEGNVTGTGGSNSAGGGGQGGEGGAVTINGASSEVRGCTFNDNRTGAGGAGGTVGGSGGIAAGLEIVAQTPDTVIVDCRFVDNRTGGAGSGNLPGGGGRAGGLYFGSAGAGNLFLAHSIFDSNQSPLGAGADIATASNPSGTGSVTIVDVVFRSNAATIGGGLRYETDGTGGLLLSSSTFSGNTATDFAGGILYVTYESAGNAPVRFVNNIVWGNVSPFGPQIGGSNSAQNVEVMATVDHNDIQGGCDTSPTSLFVCSSNLNVDPQFTNAGSGDVTLQSGSPVRDLGDSSALPADVADVDGDGDVAETLPIDLAGATRVVGAAVDMGAYELP